MMIYLGALVLTIYISASAALPPCVCTRDLKPVCGTDGTTYNNECLLDCARTRGKSDLAVERRGRCDFPGIQGDPNSCICTLELKPVCGSDGQTYPNSCAMGCQARARGVEIVKTHDGECRQKREITLPDYTCMCTMELMPLCASDGKSYPNQCAMECQARGSKVDIVKVYDGECGKRRDSPNDCICTMDYRPVCASDGNTYPNSCAMGCQARARGVEIVKTHDGECRQKREITFPDYPCMDCTHIVHMPVCGSDGKSYPNQCAMKCQARGSKVDIVKVYDGECGKKRFIASDCMCPNDYLPVCASDGQTYPSHCAMDCTARATSEKLLKVHEGECRSKRDTVKVAKLDRCVCTKEEKPVCGTDGHTYSNTCLLRCTKQVKPDLEIQHGGSCETVERVEDIPTKHDPCVCKKNFDPVCSTSGETFSNECRLQCAGAQLAHQGPCDGVPQQAVVEENS